MRSSNRLRIARALARSRSLKAREAELDARDQRLRREFEELEARKNGLRERGGLEPAARAA